MKGGFLYIIPLKYFFLYCLALEIACHHIFVSMIKNNFMGDFHFVNIV